MPSKSRNRLLGKVIQITLISLKAYHTSTPGVTMISFPYEVSSPENPRGTFTITVRVPVPAQAPPSEVVSYIRSAALKSDISSGWVAKNVPNHGLAVSGGPRPILADPKDRSSVILAYEQDFRLCPRI